MQSNQSTQTYSTQDVQTVVIELRRKLKSEGIDRFYPFLKWLIPKYREESWKLRYQKVWKGQGSVNDVSIVQDINRVAEFLEQTSDQFRVSMDAEATLLAETG